MGSTYFAAFSAMQGGVDKSRNSKDGERGEILWGTRVGGEHWNDLQALICEQKARGKRGAETIVLQQ